jgi:ribonucleoside-diphosphate reductase alpha chain
MDAVVEASTVETYLGIRIDHARTARLTDQSQDLLKKFYLRKGEDPQQGYARACVAWSAFDGVYDLALAQRLYDYVSKGWFGFASPVLSNAPLPGEAPKGLPISCFAGYVPDTLEGLIEHSDEFRWLSVMGGGVGGHWGDVRSVSDKAPGPIPFIKTMDADSSAYRQGKTRKGSYVAYLNVDHPEIREFIQLRLPTGDQNRKCLSTGFNNAVNISDKFMAAVYDNLPWDLIDPHTREVTETVSARGLWELMIETRTRTGEPYLNFIDTAQRALPDAQQKLGLTLKGSNLCNEIHLPTGYDYNNQLRTFVCCLSSVNAEMFDDWFDDAEQFIGDLVTMLDNVLQFFIDHAPETIATARYSAQMERALGLGTMGVHAFLQRQGLAWESAEAVEADRHLHAVIQNAAIRRSLALGAERGEAPDMRGTGRRNSHLMSIAPTANNASIAGTSPGIENWAANAFAHRTRAGTHLIKNTYLEQVLAEFFMDDEETWQSILVNGGSIQHLDLPDDVKAIFKTAIEVDQMWVVKHAAARQRHICQGQSLNLFFPPKASRSYVGRVHFKAWELGCKGLYYYRTETRNKADVVSKKIERVALIDAAPVEADDCIACQG